MANSCKAPRYLNELQKDPNEAHNWIYLLFATIPQGYKTFFILNSAEHQINPAHKC